MASVRINIFENLPTLGFIRVSNNSNGTLQLHRVYIPGSISFNNIAILQQGNDILVPSFTALFGLYSLNGSTLSLANSASGNSSLHSTNAVSWITLVTSATQDITPGDWYFGYIISTGGAAVGSAVGFNHRSAAQGAQGGPFFIGKYSVSTFNFPSSIDTSTLDLDGGPNAGSSTSFMPYILIAA